MKVLLDENIPERFWNRLGLHEVRTVSHMGWRRLKNGELLGRADDKSFDVFVTADQNLSYQQKLSDRRIALIVLSTNNRELLEKKLGVIINAIDEAQPGLSRRSTAPHRLRPLPAG